MLDRSQMTIVFRRSAAHMPWVLHPSMEMAMFRRESAPIALK
jgi:hypothetical protein